MQIVKPVDIVLQGIGPRPPPESTETHNAPRGWNGTVPGITCDSPYGGALLRLCGTTQTTRPGFGQRLTGVPGHL